MLRGLKGPHRYVSRRCQSRGRIKNPGKYLVGATTIGGQPWGNSRDSYDHHVGVLEMVKKNRICVGGKRRREAAVDIEILKQIKFEAEFMHGKTDFEIECISRLR